MYNWSGDMTSRYLCWIVIREYEPGTGHKNDEYWFKWLVSVKFLCGRIMTTRDITNVSLRAQI